MPAIAGVLREMWLAARGLRHARSFAITTIVTLAIGIGCTTVVFSVLEALLLRSLPYAEPENLVLVTPAVPVVWWDVVEGLQDTGVFDQMGVCVERAANLSGGNAPERILVAGVSAQFLSLARVKPTIGRVFSAEEFSAGHERVALVTEELWRKRYEGSAHAIGRPLNLDDRTYTIVGVLPPTFRTPAQLEPGRGLSFDVRVGALIPLAGRPSLYDPTSTDDSPKVANIVGRIRNGVPFARARSLVATVAAQATPPTGRGALFSLVPLIEGLNGQVPKQLALLSAAVGVLMLVACVNIANLLLERLQVRRREIAVRSALGASFGQLAVSTVGETVWLSLLGGVAGVGLAAGGLRAVRVAAAPMVTRIDEMTLNWPVFAFAGVLTLGTGLVLGLLASLSLRHKDVASGLPCEPGARRVRAGLALPSGLVVAQVALSVNLVIIAVLLAQGFARSLPHDLRYRPAGILVAEVSLDRSRYTGAAASRFIDRLLERAAALPQVERTAAAGFVPGGRAGGVMQVQVAGGPTVYVYSQVVSEDFFSVLSIPMLAGRSFQKQDGADTAPVVVVNEAFARKNWGSAGAAIGRPVLLWGRSAATVIGVAADAHDSAAAWDISPTVYMNYKRLSSVRPATQMTLLIRTAASTEPTTVAAPLRELAKTLDSTAPLYNVRPLRDIVYAKVAPARLMLNTMVLFAVITLLLSAIGVHGVMALAVALRRREIGVRRALGGTGRAIFVLIMARALRLVAAGTAIALPVVLTFTWLLQSEVFDVGAADVTACLEGVAIVVVVGMCAALSAARRAVRVDPMAILRSE